MKDFITKSKIISLYKDNYVYKRNYVFKCMVFILWIGVWQAAHKIIGRDIYVPSPLHVFTRLSELIFLTSFWKAVFLSVFRVVAGILLSIIFGLIGGVASGLNVYIREALNPLVAAIKATPVISFIILALIWFTSSNVPIFICFLMCFPIIYTNVAEGIVNVDTRLLEMAKVYKVNRSDILGKIYIPAIQPYFFAACFTSLGLGWKVSVASEVLSHPRNAIGSSLYSAKVYLDSVDLFAWTLVVVVLSLIFEYVLQYFFKRKPRVNDHKELIIEEGDQAVGNTY